MTIKLFNTLARQKEEFIPLEEGKVRFYVCGPTVYSYIHIGNARAQVAFDTIRRYLEYREYQVNFVSNFTDVDDKIIKAAYQEGISPKELSDKYIDIFLEDIQALNIKPATHRPRVMENIQEIIEFIQTLVEKGYAYENSGDVYFRTSKFENYGRLSDQSIADLREGASQRVRDEESHKKETPLDFALWKKAKEGEISWDSPWSQGRPGWHIECSVMASKYLGQQIDIHGGGQDLQFPHHENEIAQSEAHCDHAHPFSNYWLHNGLVTIGESNEKMSKSLGNTVLLRDLLKQYDPMVLRYLLATVHYRRPLKFDDNALTSAESQVQRLKEVYRRINYRLDHPGQGVIDQNVSQLLEKTIKEQVYNFEQAMNDDFNAANAMTAVHEIIKQMNTYLEQESIQADLLTSQKAVLDQLLEVFGLNFEEKTVLDSEIENLIEERNQARRDKDFSRADQIRDWLKEQGILLDDTPQGTRWKRG